ncbi:hypothetical protein JRO89_XS05G0260100 [Xanthoceras sorbifolium]|uniref:Uncharacterized protein n=1 Tax=Xanthoceras sorbifolium TaxID=99658 RepID=A0ABQ8I3B4_9ROSI|nr:hypothetical protein JRO89_XS05G0260100 [Xanthoceras sorbifolium]
MQKRRLAILQKVSNLLKISIFVARMRRKPIIAKLVLLKRSRSTKLIKSSRFNLLKHYNNNSSSSNVCRFIEEYQFSASSTPLIDHYGHHHKKQQQQLKSRIRREFFFLSRCFGGLKNGGRRRRGGGGGGEKEYSLAMERYNMHGVAGEPEALEPLDLDQDDDDDDDNQEDSVDQRAERFIEWFYQEMRLQRQESI